MIIPAQPGQQPGSIQFWGTPAAELFTRELDESFQGVMAKNRVGAAEDPMLGFISASIEGRPWTDTMWTRDAGVFLRELVMWGSLEAACQTAECLMKLVRPNPDGFLTFPMYFKKGEAASGSELDGTAAIVIALLLLGERLGLEKPTWNRLREFLVQPASPLRYFLKRLESHPLIPGSGEFGGGVGIEGEFYNVVQNNLARLALLISARVVRGWREIELSGHCARAASQMEQAMLAYMVDPQKGWIWTVDMETLRPDPAILDSVINQGFGGLNGVLAMCADGALEPLLNSPEIGRVSLQTLESLYQQPLRRRMFDKYGAWTQFDRLWDGLLTSPSYGQGYAIQALLLADRLGMAGRAIEFLARTTIEPLRGNRITRESPYLFYERIYLPELLDAWTSGSNLRAKQPDWIANGFDGSIFDEGCGALNLVNVAEPMKIARLILGVEDNDKENLKLIPRLPPGWKGCKAQNWPVLTPAGLIRIGIQAEVREGKVHLEVDLPMDCSLPVISARLPEAAGWRWVMSSQTKGKVQLG